MSSPATNPSNCKRGAFADVYRKNCQFVKGYPLSFVLTPTYFASAALRVPADKVLTSADWDLLVGALTLADDLRCICLWSVWWSEKKQQLLRLKSTADLDKARDALKARVPLVLHAEILDPLVKSIGAALRHCKDLTSLTLAGLVLNVPAVRTLSIALVRSTSLSHLSLARCEIGHQGFSELAGAIKSSTSLTVLDLSDNLLTHASAALLAEAIKSQSVRRVEAAFPHLLRSSRPLAALGAADSGYGASHYPSSFSAHARRSSAATPGSPAKPHGSGAAVILKRVNLSCNPIGDGGLYHLLDALQNDVGVQAIDLQRTRLTSDGVEAALLVLQDVPGAAALDVRNNPDADPELIRQVHAIGAATCARDPDLARIPDGRHPLEASLFQGAGAPPRLNLATKTKSASSRYKVAAPSPAGGTTKPATVKPIGPRAAWRPAGILPPRQSADTRGRAREKRGSRPASPTTTAAWHPVVNVDEVVGLVETNCTLAAKVDALELALLTAMETPPPSAETWHRQQMQVQQHEYMYHGFGYEQQQQQQQVHAQPMVGAGVHWGDGLQLQQPHHHHQPPQHQLAVAVAAPEPAPAPSVPAPQPPTAAAAAAAAAAPAVSVPSPPSIAWPTLPAPLVAAAPAPATAPAPADSPPRTTTHRDSPDSDASLLALGAAIKSLHAHVRSAATCPWSAYTARHAAARVSSLIPSSHPTATDDETSPAAMLARTAAKLAAAAEAADRRWWDKHPDTMRRVVAVDAG
ncbi:hypothetical protein H9P43_008464 [Blastocladiella emersonii ATCC 22665]|nr:hypothetical protein H9P43_008464 [Blastocladiella emersonii ATCC 22665]